jgi:SPP1 gp7 family putative phage head morphogenesis protein
MDQLEIEEFLDRLAKDLESDIEAVFNRRLRAIINEIAQIYEKYADKEGIVSWTDINRYNRLRKELERIHNQLNETYQEIVSTIQESTEYIFLEGYMRSMYLYEMTSQTSMRVTLPSIQVIRQILKNPIEELTLPKTLEPHRNEIIRRINIEIAQGIQAGESYPQMVKRIQNAVKFSRKKAIRVVRTEAGRARSMANIKATEQASKYAKMTGVWLSALDLRVRRQHRELDGKETDKDGYFHYRGLKAKGPHLWGTPEMDINCRCVRINKINGKFPIYRRGRNYMDPDYQRKLADRIDKYMEEGLTYKQALKKADKEIKPPSIVMDYVTYDDWYKKHA